MPKSFEQLEAEAEISYCVTSLRDIVETFDDLSVIHKVRSSLPAILKRAEEKRFDLVKVSKRKLKDKKEEK